MKNIFYSRQPEKASALPTAPFPLRIKILLLVGLNLIVLVIAAAYPLRRYFTAWQEAGNALRLLENRAAQKERHLANYAANLAQLEALTADWEREEKWVQPYAQLADSLAAIHTLGRLYALREIEFYTGEMLAQETGTEGKCLEIKATSVYEGSYANINAFLAALAESDTYYRLEQCTIDMLPPTATPLPDASSATYFQEMSARLHLHFSVYGIIPENAA